MTRFTYETKKPCATCKREVDAVRVSDLPGLRISRHLAVRGGLCPESLIAVPSSQAAE